MNKTSTVILLLLIISFKAYSSEENRIFYDVNNFDIAGVKLGMGFQQAKEAIRAKLNLSENEIRDQEYPQENIVTKTKEKSYFIVNKGKTTVSVYFKAAVPYDKQNPMRVSQVIYKMPRTPDNKTNMNALALKKYGTPTNKGLSKYEWCKVEKKKQKWGCTHAVGPIMSLHAPVLKMYDPSYNKAISDYRNSMNSEKAMF